MTNSQTILIIKLLTGHSLVVGKNKQRKKCYRLLDAKHNPIEIIKAKTVDKLDQYIDRKIKIWKKDKYGRITLNLSMVRQLHGRSKIKKLYKNRESLDSTGSIYKSRTKKKKSNKTTDNEKVLYLF